MADWTAALPLAGAVVGGAIGFSSALGLKVRDERRVGRAVRRQIISLATYISSEMENIAKEPGSRIHLENNPAIPKFLDRAFSPDASVALTRDEAYAVHDAALAVSRANEYIFKFRDGAQENIPNRDIVMGLAHKVGREMDDVIRLLETRLPPPQPR